jgi:hypothetical protein
LSRKDLVLSLHEEGLTTKEIHERLVEIFGRLAMPYSTVTRTSRETCRTASEDWSENSGGRPLNFDHDARILSVLQENPNASVREIPDEKRIPKSNVFDILRPRLHYSARNYRFVPHALTEPKEDNVWKNQQRCFSVRAKAKRRPWELAITADESLFFYYTPHSKIWLPPDTNAPEVARRLINTPKMMITIFRNPFGIHALALLPEKTFFDAEYFLDYLLIPTEELSFMHASAIQMQTLVIHMNNSPTDKSKATLQRIASSPVKIAPYPRYSPDLAL